jgi:cytoskeleton-associated protein 5
MGGMGGMGFRTMSPTLDDGHHGGVYGAGVGRNRMSMASTLSGEEKENGGGDVAATGMGSYPRSKVSPTELRYGAGSTASSGRGSPAKGFRRDMGAFDDRGEQQPSLQQQQRSGSVGGGGDGGYSGETRSGSRTGSRTGGRETPSSVGGGAGGPTSGMESWKRAAEVTSQLKARIEQMKVCYFSRLLSPYPAAV